MIIQEYEVFFINGRVIKCAEQVGIPADKRLHNRFKASKPDDVLVIGSRGTGEAYIPVRNILYISAGSMIGV